MVSVSFIMIKNCFISNRNFSTVKDQTKKLEVDNQKMEQQLQELKIAMSRERAERE